MTDVFRWLITDIPLYSEVELPTYINTVKWKTYKSLTTYTTTVKWKTYK